MERGLQQGLERELCEGSLKEAREMVLQAVRVKFGVVPANMEAQLDLIESRMTFGSLHERAILSESLELFREAPRQALEV